jgi:hypothetical protein
MKKTTTVLLLLLVMAPLAWGEDGPRTGYFRKSITPLGLQSGVAERKNGATFWRTTISSGSASSMVVTKKPINERMLRAILAQAVLERDYKIDTDRYYLFMFGPKDKDRQKMQRIAAAYKAAGVDNTEVVSVANINRQMPGSSYFEQAIEFLDAR